MTICTMYSNKGFVAVDSLFIIAPITCRCYVFGPIFLWSFFILFLFRDLQKYKHRPTYRMNIYVSRNSANWLSFRMMNSLCIGNSYKPRIF